MYAPPPSNNLVKRFHVKSKGTHLDQDCSTMPVLFSSRWFLAQSLTSVPKDTLGILWLFCLFFLYLPKLVYVSISWKINMYSSGLHCLKRWNSKPETHFEDSNDPVSELGISAAWTRLGSVTIRLLTRNWCGAEGPVVHSAAVKDDLEVSKLVFHIAYLKG